MAALRRTTLYDEHVAAGARFVPFAGFEMPIQYRGIIEEHRAVREAAGLFDVSHMGQVFLRGSAIDGLLDRCFTNNHARSALLEQRYTFVLNDVGAIKDDLIITRLGPQEHLAIPNAATTPAIVAWLQQHAGAGQVVDDQSDGHFCLALQGPRAQAVLQPMVDADLAALAFFRAAWADLGCSAPVLVSRSGYTGEEGFELVGPAADAPALWRRLLEAGAASGLQPVGLGARDTLRMEKGFLLSGQDFHEDRTPLETNTGFAVKYDHPFIGREALEDQKAHGGYARLCGLRLAERKGVPRPGMAVLHQGQQVGTLCSGTQSPTLGVGIGLAYLHPPLDTPGTPIAVEIRSKAVAGEVAALPLVPAPVRSR